MNPIQPIQKDEYGTLRFKKNLIVDYLLNFSTNNGCGLNELASMDFPKEDWQQLAQLIGYSLDGYVSLSYVDDVSYCTVVKLSKNIGADSKDVVIETLQTKLNSLKEALREPVAELYEIHPDDLL